MQYGLEHSSILPLETYLREGATLELNESYLLFTPWIFENKMLSCFMQKSELHREPPSSSCGSIAQKVPFRE